MVKDEVPYAQLIAYLEGEPWLRNARHANAMAARLASGLTSLSEVQLVQRVEANELFVAIPETLMDSLLAEGFEFHRRPKPLVVSNRVVRFVTAFCTTTADVDSLIAAFCHHATQ